MTRDQAIRKLRAMFGARASWEVRKDVSSPEKRAAKAAEAERLAAEVARLDTEIAERKRAAGIYELEAQRNAAYKAKGEAKWYAGMFGYRFEVSERTLLGVTVKGYGDTWEQAIAMAEKRQAEEAAERAANRKQPSTNRNQGTDQP
jgi:hypothetical protein